MKMFSLNIQLIIIMFCAYIFVNVFAICKNVKPMENFHQGKILGTWILHRTNEINRLQSCVKYDFQNGDSSDSLVLIRSSKLFLIPTLYKKEQFALNRVEDSAEYMESVKIPAVTVPIWVLGTDYKNYLILYKCGVLNHENILILTKERFPESSLLEETQNILSHNSISLENLHTINQTNCHN